MRTASLALAMAALLHGSAGAAEFVPVGRVSALGGQIFFHAPDGRNTSFAGTGDWLLAPALSIDDKDALVPTLMGQYLDRTQVKQIGGGGRLTTETFDNTASMRWVRKLGDWTLKPNVSYKNELITTNSDERLGAGLFDYHKYGTGLDAEWKGGSFRSVRQSLSFYRANFYHYQAARSPLFGLELLSSDRALDFYQYGYLAAADYDAWSSGFMSATAQVSVRDFRHQDIVEQHAFSSSKRMDVFSNAIVGATQNLDPQSRPLSWISAQGSVGTNLGWTNVASDQNDFDAARLKFTPGFYSYRELSVGPWFSLRWENGANVTITYTYARRQYAHRFVQNADGSYTSDTIHSDNHTVSYSASYPLGKGFALALAGGYSSLASNMRFEQAYRYNYDYAFYFAGLTYSF